MEFVIIDRNERQWLAALDSSLGAEVPAKYNKFFVKKKTLEKSFNGKVLKRNEWVIMIESIDDLLNLRVVAPNSCISIGEVWGYPAIIV